MYMVDLIVNNGGVQSVEHLETAINETEIYPWR